MRSVCMNSWLRWTGLVNRHGLRMKRDVVGVAGTSFTSSSKTERKHRDVCFKRVRWIVVVEVVNVGENLITSSKNS